MRPLKIILGSVLVIVLACSVVLAQSTATKPATGKSDTSSSAASTSTTAKTAKSDTAATKSKTPDSQKVDINGASKEDLDKLPGIGAAYSQKIIDGRPYNSKRDLLTRKIIPQATYDGIADKIIAHRAKDAKGTTDKGTSKSSAASSSSTKPATTSTPAK